MFGFSRKRMKLGRVKKVQLSDSAQGTRSPIRPLKKIDKTNSDYAAPHGDERSARDQSMASNNNNSTTSGSSESWIALSVAGDKPAPRSNHAAAVIGNKMIVVGGESANGLLDDVKVLNFGNFTWTTASSKLYLSPSSLPLKIPACKGHCLVSWGKKALLVGGKTDPGNDRVTVWAFDTETECWSLIEAKGDIPVARSGHTVVRASSALILFGGEDAKRRKLNDLHVFDLKSLTWLPLHCTGTGPCPRANHVAALYDDQTLFIFGGSSKSKTLNDLYSLDFEKMLWSRIKVKGFHPSPRAGCCAVLCGTSWYIVGGGSKKKRHTETVIFDILKSEWSLPVASPPSSITNNKGFSLVLGQHKDKNFLVSFGGSKKEPSNQIEVHLVEKMESSMGPHSVLGKFEGHMQFGKRLPLSGLATNFGNGSSKQPVDSVARQSLASAVEHHGSGRKSLSELTLDHSPASGNVSLRKQFRDEEEYTAVVKFAKNSEDEHLGLQGIEQRTNQSAGVQPNPAAAKISSEDPTSHESETSFPRIEGILRIPMENDHFAFSDNECKLGGSAPSSIHQYYETKMAELIRKNGILEGQLVAAQASREVTEKHLSAAVRGRQEMEKKLTDSVKEMEMLKEKLAAIELAQEEAHSMSDIVHSDNVRLEHDVAFLKAVLEDTQKELHSTRGVLAGERARAFQLQVEVFHLKQRLQSLESRAPTPRKPFPV